jgi:uncharacterized protein YacL
MILSILRGVFILLAAAVTVLYVLPFQADQEIEFERVLLMIVITLGVAGTIIAADVLSPRKKLSAISGVFLGLIAGLLAAYALGFVVDLIGVLVGEQLPGKTRDSFLNLLQGVKVLIGLVTCYLSISLVLQTKDDFRFVIPYVEFAKQIRGPRPTIVDTSVIIDGRVLDIVDTRVMQGMLLIPKFVINELQTVADSSDKLRRARGRRGLDMLRKLQENPAIEVEISDAPAEGDNVDQKLVSLAQQVRGRLMTNDFNLTKVARLRGVDVINLNDLTQSLRPVVLPGETMTVRIIKPGEEPGQGVGYLEDGTMIVVKEGRPHVGEEVQIVVTNHHQTAAGRMLFGRYLCGEAPGGIEAEGDHQHDRPTSHTARDGSDDPHEQAPPTPAVEAHAAPDESDTKEPPHQPRRPRATSGRNPRRG